ncbi:hypothetical protein H0H93_001164 [Arthromyces matolae]|nr:hypothetical protein H0H93_001164 [Arthromyces matolae]
MDDEQPPSKLSTPDDDDTQSSGDENENEDGSPDWTSLPRPIIPKRGEKEFEPKPGGGSGLQVHVLDTARSAMFDTLRSTRNISSKAVSYAIWYPNIGRSHVTLAKGIHFSSIGHSAPRSAVDDNGVDKVQKRLELLPEETIYLVERGSLFCWKDTSVDISRTQSEMSGAPMTVQQVYAEMLGVEGLTLEKLQVYTYLKRLGYSVTRANPPTHYYPVPPPWPQMSIKNGSPSIWRRTMSFFSRWLYNAFLKTFDWWRPLRISRWLHHNKNYASLFQSLRFMTSGHKVALHLVDSEKKLETMRNSPYQIFYNLYKPSTSFKRSAPPLPDFQIVVVNARTTPMPTLQELTSLFDILPELPPPLPRIRRPLSTTGPISEAPQARTLASASSRSAPATLVQNLTLIQRVYSWVFSSPSQLTQPVRRPHPFMALKSGKKHIVIAAVDSGNISFFRFGQGDFTEWPMV